MRGLAEEADWIFENDVIDLLLAMSAFAHFKARFRDGQRIAMAPIAGGIHPKIAAGMAFKDINGAGGGAFGFGVKRDPAPKPGIEHHADRMLLDVINKDAPRVNAPVAFQNIEDQACSFPFVFKMRRVDENELIVACREINMFLENGNFVAAVAIQSDLADAQHAGSI